VVQTDKQAQKCLHYTGTLLKLNT